LATLQTIHRAYHESDNDENGNNLFGTDGVVGAYVIAQVYQIVPIGSSKRIDGEMKEKVFNPLGIELVADPTEEKSASHNFYNHLGRGLTQRQSL